eukprot:Lithocolla_globosa_v1_NODE_963_length_3017_cov_27.468940.p2 type:complete len:152 gc:universal NODE_963_length_3017_cov_27.468940:2687-2232(-)
MHNICPIPLQHDHPFKAHQRAGRLFIILIDWRGYVIKLVLFSQKHLFKIIVFLCKYQVTLLTRRTGNVSCFGRGIKVTVIVVKIKHDNEVDVLICLCQVHQFIVGTHCKETFCICWQIRISYRLDVAHIPIHVVRNQDFLVENNGFSMDLR